jgi:pilus assembly protein CpaC
MNLLTAIITILFPILSWAADIHLRMGETKKISARGNAWVEKSKILKISETPGGFVLKGRTPGQSQMKIGAQIFYVTVLSPSQEKTFHLLEKTMPKTLGLRLKIIADKIAVEGQLLRWSDWKKIYHACESQNCDFQMRAQISASIQPEIQLRANDLFKSQGTAPQNLIFGQPIRALVSDKISAKSPLMLTLAALGILANESKQNIDLQPLLKIHIIVAEVKRASLIKYGIQWPESYDATVLPKVVGVGETSFPTLHLLETEGMGKILASPNILCRSGKKAEFLAGGEIPIKIMNYKTNDVIWKKYGVMLKVEPIADFSGKMSIAIETEVSTLDRAHTVDGIPGIFTNRVQSYFDLSESRIIALSGLIKNEQSEASQGLPGLSRIPILGPLFSSKEFIENRTELVVFVRPEIVSPGSLEARR